jgi:hypothetical protein
MIQNPINAMINFNYFMLNFNSDFIAKCWKYDPNMIVHLEEKFAELYKRKETALFPFFFCELSTDRQIELSKWINDNYLAFKHLNF